MNDFVIRHIPVDCLVRVGAMIAGLTIGLVAGSGLFPRSADAIHCEMSTQQRRYASAFSTQAAYGIDGYIAPGTGTLSDPQCNKIARFLNVTPNSTGAPTTWLQVGVRIGTKSVNPS